MWRFVFIPVVMAITMFATGCASMHSCRDCCSQCCDKGPKTLLKWEGKEEDKDKCKENGKEDEKKAAEKNGKNGEEKNGANGEKKEEPAKPEVDEKDGEVDEPKEIETDRPDFTEASTTVGKGHIQLEAGYTYSRDRADGVTTHSHSYPEMLLRIGMCADWFELRLGQNFGALRDEGAAAINTTNGAEDLYLGTKLALTEQKKCLPECALILQTLLPTGHDDFTANKVMPGANLLYGWDIIKDFLTCAGSSQVNRAVDGATHYYSEFAQSITVGYSLTKKLGAYTEWFAFFPAGAISPDVGPEHYFDGGFTYKVTSNFQLDIRAGVGLNRHAEDFFAGTGFAVKY